MRTKGFEIQKIIEYLIGQECKEQQAFDELYPGMLFEDINKKEKMRFEEALFMCDSCGRWCEVDERYSTDGNGDFCESCKTDDEGMDDDGDDE